MIHKQVAYFTAVMYNPAVILNPDELVEEAFGKTLSKSSEFIFDHTRYYEPEMGGGLIKYFASFIGDRDPGSLAEYKLKAIQMEALHKVGNSRAINLDPGYVAVEKVVVASTKNFTHRIYLRDGIYGDLQLMRQKGGYSAMPWTYADYMRLESLAFFHKLGDDLLKSEGC